MSSSEEVRPAEAEVDDLEYVEPDVTAQDVTQPLPYADDFDGVQDDEAAS